MHATTATFLAGGRGRSALSNDAAYCSLLARRSSVALTGTPSDGVGQRYQVDRFSLLRFDRGTATFPSVSVGHTSSSENERKRLVLDLARRLRDRGLAALGSPAGRSFSGGGAGGDITFAVDEVAEESLVEFLAERAPRVAYYSEDRGLVASGNATEVLVVDPIDGTRPAMAGLESACVAVAMAPLGDGNPTMSDVCTGCV